MLGTSFCSFLSRSLIFILLSRMAGQRWRHQPIAQTQTRRLKKLLVAAHGWSSIQLAHPLGNVACLGVDLQGQVVMEVEELIDGRHL
jgi:hypothetical protein